MPTTTSEITTISEIEIELTETTPKVEIETTNSTYIWGLPSSGVMQCLTTSLLVFAILISCKVI